MKACTALLNEVDDALPPDVADDLPSLEARPVAAAAAPPSRIDSPKGGVLPRLLLRGLLLCAFAVLQPHFPLVFPVYPCD